MSKLKASVVFQVARSLETYDFCKEDFEIITPENENRLLTIRFRPMNDYFFEMMEATKGSKLNAISNLVGTTYDEERVIRTIETPGDHKTQEIHDFKNIDIAISRISTWTRNIQDDLLSRKNLENDFDDITEEVYEAIRENLENPEEYFNKSEKDRLHEQLNELRKRVESLEKENKIEESERQEIENAIQQGEKNINLYPKGVWYKTAGTKIMRTIKQVLKTKEGRELVATAFKKLINME